jgi:flagellar basal body-associated protein FliL
MMKADYPAGHRGNDQEQSMDDKKTAEANDAEQVPAKKLPLKMIIVVAGVLLLEGLTIGVFMMISDPAMSQATNPIEAMVEPAENNAAEVLLVDEQQVDNYTQGRTRMLVTFRIYVKTRKDQQEKLEELVDKHSTEIRDRIRLLVASASPENVRDPMLQVIKRDVKVSLEKILPADMIEEVLIPNWQSMETD